MDEPTRRGDPGPQGDGDHALRELAVEQAAGCELCEARRLTTWYFEDDHCWIADCEICEVPMVVWRSHGATPPPEVKERLHDALRAIADALFGAEGYVLDDHMRNIPDHYHAHARDLSFWGRFAGRARTTIPGARDPDS